MPILCWNPSLWCPSTHLWRTKLTSSLQTCTDWFQLFLWEFYMGTATGWNHPAQISRSLVTHWPTLYFAIMLVCIDWLISIAYDVKKSVWFLVTSHWNYNQNTKIIFQTLYSEILSVKYGTFYLGLSLFWKDVRFKYVFTCAEDLKKLLLWDICLIFSY